MQMSDKSVLFEETSIPGAVVRLALPTMASSLVMVIYSMADTYFVGALGSAVQTAAVSLAYPLLLSFNAINNLFGVGSSSMMGRALGRKDGEVVRRSSSFGFWAALLSGLLFSLVYTTHSEFFLSLIGADAENRAATAAYLHWTVTFGAAPAILNVVMAYLVRTEGASIHASVGTMGGCLLNMILDPLLILPWGLNMGAAGAGLATFISNCFACLYFFVLLFVRRKKTCVCINPVMAIPRKDVALGVFVVGIPAAIQNLLNVTGMTILNNFTAVYGSNAVAAMGISYKIYMVPMQVILGLSQGIMPLISYCFGNQNYERMKEALFFVIRIGLVFLLAVVIVLFAFPGFFVGLFIDSAEIVEYGKQFLRGMSLALPFISIDFMSVGVFQSCGKGAYSLIFAVTRKVILEIPALLILNHIFPLYGLAYAQTTAEFVMAFVAVFFLRRLFAGFGEKE